MRRTTWCRALTSLNVGAEAHLEQLVGLVEHEHAEAVAEPVDPVVGQVVVETAGRRDQDGRGRIEELEGPEWRRWE